MIWLLEPARPPGFVSGGYRFQDAIGQQLSARGLGEQRAIAATALAEVVAELRNTGAPPLIVVDGRFVELTGRPLPAGVIALLHGVPALAPWSVEPMRVITTSQPTADALRGRARSLAVVRPGLESCFQPPPAPGRHARLRIVCTGTIRPEKGQLLLATHLAALQPRPPCELILLGCDRTFPTYAVAVRSAATGLSLRNAGTVPPERVAHELQQADLFVSASRQESFGMAVAEAAACGAPVLAFATGEIASFVHDGKNGWLVGADASDAAFTARLTELLAAPARLGAARAQAVRPPLGDWATAATAFVHACRG